MKKLLKEKKAITLIALVITIVVLVILAAVTISMTVGNDGLIAKAIKAANDYKNAQEKDKQGINDLYGQLSIATDGTIQNLTLEKLEEIIDKKTSSLQTTINTLNETVTTLQGTVDTLSTNYTTLNNNLTTLQDKTVKYPDFSRRIKTINTANASWTATEDCYVDGYVCIKKNGGTAQVYLDGKSVLGVANTNLASGKITTVHGSFFVKKGSVVSTRDGTDYEYSLSIFALK